MSFTVVFIASSSVQSIPNAVRAKGQSRPPRIALSPYSNISTIFGVIAQVIFFLERGQQTNKAVTRRPIHASVHTELMQRVTR